MINKEELFPIGIGTWKIDCEDFNNEIEALLYSYNNGQNYLPMYMLYNNGEVVKQMKSFVDRADRNKLFITATLEPTIEKVEDIEKQLDEYLETLDISYVDSLQIHGYFVSKLPLVDVYKEIERLVEMGKVRYIGISNVNLKELQKVDKEVKIDFFEGVYNLECKVYEDNGVLEYCKKRGIQFVAYQPLRRNRTAMRNYNILKKLAKKYNKTRNQIIINWIVKEKNILPLIKSTNIGRINKNIASLDFEMEESDYEKLNEFRNEDFDNVEIDWYCKGGITIDQLANQFE